MMTIRNAKTKAAIIQIDDEGNMTILDGRGFPERRYEKVEIEEQEKEDAS